MCVSVCAKNFLCVRVRGCMCLVDVRDLGNSFIISTITVEYIYNFKNTTKG